MRTLQLLITIFLALTLATGCTKKRPNQFAQGQGLNLDGVNDFQGKTFWLKTGEALTAANSTEAERLQVQESVRTFNNFPLVRYKTNADLLGEDLPFRGRPNTTYEVRYRLTDNYLKIYKVAKKEDLPFSEWSYAEQLPDGRLAVPLVGYGVMGYYRVENARNGDNEKTHVMIEIPEKNPTQASHFKIDRLNRRIFSAIEKIDVYPADFFNGEWFYSETTIDTKVGQEMEIGGVGGVDTNLSMASRIRILLNSNSYMRGANVNIDSRLNAADDLSYEYVFNIPIAWKEYRASRQGTETSLQEEEVFEQVPTKRPYIKIEFENLITTSNELTSALSIFNKILGVQKVVDIQFSPDYFSFTLLKVATGSRIKYSFLRAKNRTYQAARRHFKDDRKVYGYFTTARNVIIDRDFQRREDFERNVFLNRFDPNKDIVFHFTSNTPQKKWIRDVGRAAVKHWNRAFELAGAKARVKLDETQDVALGDIRYNTLNFLYTITGSNLNGFGPSLADPFTGEIITATTNIHVNSSLDILAAEIRNYMRDKIGIHGFVSRTTGISLDEGTRGDRTSIFMEPHFTWKGDGKTPQPWSIVSWQGPEFERTASVELSQFKPTMQISHLIKAMDKRGEVNSAWDAFNRFRALFQKHPDLETIESLRSLPLRNGTTQSIARRVESSCKSVTDFVAEVRQSQQIDTQKERNIIEDCIQKIAFPYMLGVTLHEMGHNLGLRHNFFASSDLNNFYTPEETQRLFNVTYTPEDIPMSASVMDYPAWGQENRTLPGKYDIAAIRFGYADSVELRNGEIKPIDINKPLTENLGGGLASLKATKFCTDEDASLLIDPMCARWDHGATPEAVVDYTIAAFWSTMVTDNHRYDRVAPNLQGVYVRARALMALKRYYDQWRIHLAEFMGVGREYLDQFEMSREGLANYQRTLQTMAAHPVYGKYYDQYYKVSRKIFNFLLQVSFLPNRYCVAQKADNSLFAIELSRARYLAYRTGVQNVQSCSDPAVKEQLRQQGLNLIGEVGHDLQTVRHSMDVKDMQEPPDVLGTMPDRLNAMRALTGRVINPLNITRKVFPSFLDEPDLQYILVSNVMGRITQGVVLGNELKRIRGLEKIEAKDSMFPAFEAEANVVHGMFQLLKGGMNVPGRRNLTQQNQMAFSYRVTQDRQAAQEAAQQERAQILPVPGAFLIATPDNELMYQLFKEVQQASALEKVPSFDLNAVKIEEIKAQVMQHLPAAADQPLTAEMLDKVLEILKAIDGRQFPMEQGLFAEVLAPHFQIRQAIQKDPALTGPTPHGREVAPGSLADAFKQMGITDVARLDYNMFIKKMSGRPPVTREFVEQFITQRLQSFALLRRVEKSEVAAKKELLMKIIMSGRSDDDDDE